MPQSLSSLSLSLSLSDGRPNRSSHASTACLPASLPPSLPALPPCPACLCLTRSGTPHSPAAAGLQSMRNTRRGHRLAQGARGGWGVGWGGGLSPSCLGFRVCPHSDPYSSDPRSVGGRVGGLSHSWCIPAPPSRAPARTRCSRRRRIGRAQQGGPPVSVAPIRPYQPWAGEAAAPEVEGGRDGGEGGGDGGEGRKDRKSSRWCGLLRIAAKPVQRTQKRPPPCQWAVS